MEEKRKWYQGFRIRGKHTLGFTSIDYETFEDALEIACSYGTKKATHFQIVDALYHPHKVVFDSDIDEWPEDFKDIDSRFDILDL